MHAIEDCLINILSRFHLALSKNNRYEIRVNYED